MLAQNAHSNNPQDAQPVQEIHRLQRCAHCQAPVYWMQHRITGRWAAIDIAFTSGGDVLVNLSRNTYEQLSQDDRAVYPGWLHALHRNICPQVDKWYQGR